MNKKSQNRGAMIDRMLEVRSEQEVEAAEKDAEGWLKENPDDIRVIAASKRLAKTGARVRDPERRADRLSLSVFAVVFASVALAAGALTNSPYSALTAGLLAALPLTELAWELHHNRSVNAAQRDGER
jgi:hypothetical protein